MKNQKVERILEDIGSKKGSDRLLKLKGDDDDFAPQSTPSKASEPMVSPHKKLGRQFLDQEYNLTLKPRIVIKWVAVVLLLISVFFLGRLTADGSGTTAILEEAVPVAVQEEPSFFTSISGFLTSILPDVDEEHPATPALVTANLTEETNATKEVAATTTEETAAEEETVSEDAAAEESDEPIITTYTKVSLSFEGVTREWKETWGKITWVKYKITNGEAGTIKPSYFMMIVEGYSEEGQQKKIPLPKSSQTIKSGTAVASSATTGFSYSESVAGNLNEVAITLQLYDAEGKLIAAANKIVDISG